MYSTRPRGYSPNQNAKSERSLQYARGRRTALSGSEFALRRATALQLHAAGNQVEQDTVGCNEAD